MPRLEGWREEVALLEPRGQGHLMEAGTWKKLAELSQAEGEGEKDPGVSPTSHLLG